MLDEDIITPREQAHLNRKMNVMHLEFQDLKARFSIIWKAFGIISTGLLFFGATMLWEVVSK